MALNTELLPLKIMKTSLIMILNGKLFNANLMINTD